MNYLTSIQQAFHSSSMNVDERMKYVNIRLSIYPSDLPSYKDLCTLVSSFPSRDTLTFSMNDDAGSSIRIASNADCPQECYSNFLADLYKDDPVHVTIEINKQVIQNQMSIYCYRNFCADLLSLSPSEVLLAFTGLYSGATHLYFEVFDENVFFKTGTMAFSSAKHSISWKFSDRKSMLDDCRNVSCFYHQTIYPLLPEDFNIEVDFADNPLTHLFSQMSTALSMAYLATTSSIVNDELRIQITGQRSIDFSTPLTKIKPNAELYKIYHWIFTDGNPVDKALLARTSISAHCKFTEISNLDGKTFASIQANYNLYLKDNVSQYIELTNAMAGFIQESTNNVSDCISELLTHLKSNLIAVVSFIFTATLANIVSDQPLDNIFTYDITLIMYLVFAGSLVYYVISILEVHCKKKRMCKQYDNIVAHYEKVLSKEEIQQITDNGQPLTRAQNSLKHGMIGWSITWVLFILVAFIVIDFIGDGPHIIENTLSMLSKLLLSIANSFQKQ